MLEFAKAHISPCLFSKIWLMLCDLIPLIVIGFINSCLSSNIEHGGFSEDGSSVSSEKENLNLQRSRIITTLENISKAYARIRDKSYGRCKTTNKLIDEARLRVHPWATQSMVAKLQTAK